MKSSGHIFYQDYAEQIYDVVWETINGVIDITSTVFTPYVWGEKPSGFIKNGILFRHGIVTITRQAIRPFNGGYELIAEGVSQYVDDIQMNYPCQTKFVDPFKYHLDRPIVDSVDGVITDGPRWADPDSDTDDTMLWGDIDSNGDPVAISGTPFEFIDVWS